MDPSQREDLPQRRDPNTHHSAQPEKHLSAGTGALKLPGMLPTEDLRTPAEQAEEAIRSYCQRRLLLLTETGLEARKARYLPAITSAMLGPQQQLGENEEWQERVLNPRYDTFSVELVGAGVDPDGNDHLFVSVTNARNEQILPGIDKESGRFTWDVDRPLITSRHFFCGIHFIIHNYAAQDGTFEQTLTPIPMLSPELANREIQRTIGGEQDTLITRLLDRGIEQELSKPSETEPRSEKIGLEIGSPVIEGQIDLLATNERGERLALLVGQEGPIHFDVHTSAQFTADSRNAFSHGRSAGSCSIGSVNDLCKNLYGNLGAAVKAETNSPRYALLLDYLHRTMLQRYPQISQLEGLRLELRQIIVDQDRRAGVVCISVQDAEGNFFLPSDDGVLAQSPDPALLVLSPSLGLPKVRFGETPNNPRSAIPWLFNISSEIRKDRNDRPDIRFTLSGVVCSERFFCAQVDDLIRAPQSSFFTPGLVDRARAQLRELQLPINALACSVLDIAGASSDTSLPHEGFVLMQHSFGKSLLHLRRHQRSGYVALRPAGDSDALFLDP
ncbi:MAG: hypothetical protein EBZ48_09480 [Proteobacteria bacterium]|nr:hypothetical protein [Pseudomonadota bacterium]